MLLIEVDGILGGRRPGWGGGTSWLEGGYCQGLSAFVVGSGLAGGCCIVKSNQLKASPVCPQMSVMSQGS